MNAAAAASPFTIAAETVIRGLVSLEAPFKTWRCTLNDFTGGAFSYVSPSCVLHRTKIGRYCSIGNRVSILSTHPTTGFTSSPVMYQPLFAAPFDTRAIEGFDNLADTEIGNDVWIGAGVQIKTGVTIGNGAVIGAGSVVTKDVQPYMILGGVPAKVIRPRFQETIIERLQTSQWWRYNILGLNLPNNPDAALAVLTQAINNGLQPYEPGFHIIWKDTKTGNIIGKREK